MKIIWSVIGVLLVLFLAYGVLVNRRTASERVGPAEVTPVPEAPAASPAGEAAEAPAPPEKSGALRSWNYAFAPATLEASPGEPIALAVENTGVHTFTIDGVVNTPLFGSSANVRFTAPSAPGTYTYYCAVPGHREKGMVGVLTVR